MSDRLAVENLQVRFDTPSGTVRAVDGASLEIAPGEVVGLVGESGCGKSVTARSIVRLESPGEIVDGSIRYGGRELTTAGDRQLRRLRGRELAMVFQDPSATLNPVYPIGEQIAEALRIHRDPDHQPLFRELARGVSSRLRSSTRRSAVLELMETVGIPRPRERIDAYPHQFSGGMRQRAMLAIALARQPSLLIADEPTTALDATTQAAILDRLATLNDTRGMGMLVISHDFGVVSELCDRILVMYDGVIVERGPTERLRESPLHPYTKALLGCLPRDAEDRTRLPSVVEPSSVDAPSGAGCAFADRCPFATDSCRETAPPVVSAGPNRAVRCDVPAAREASMEAMRDGPAETNGQPRAPSAVAVDGGTDRRTTSPVAEPVSADASPAIEADSDEWGREAGDSDAASTTPIVELEDVTKSFRQSDALLDRLLGADDRIPAVRGVSLELQSGETVGLVGESGCGKSTLAKLVSGLEEPDEGTVSLRGQQVGGVGARTEAQLAEIGVVFQHPGASLNPKLTVTDSIAEPLVEAEWDGPRRADRIAELLSLVGLSEAVADRYPRQLSGGQRQRVAIARALALEPSVLVLDEPTAALDVSTQATVLNLLADLQDELGLAYLYVSHDLAVVRHVADRVAVMYCGRLVECGPARATLSSPSHPYTRTLLNAVPDPDGNARREGTLGAEPPSPADPPSGCAFHPRCPVATPECSRIDPDLEPAETGRSRCLYADDWDEGLNRVRETEAVSAPDSDGASDDDADDRTDHETTDHDPDSSGVSSDSTNQFE